MNSSNKLFSWLPPIRTVLGVFLFISLTTCTIAGVHFYRIIQIEQAVHLATREAVDHITSIYGAEVSQIIENLELKWHSVDSHQNLEQLSDIATGRYLDLMTNQIDSDLKDHEWLIKESVIIKRLVIHEYTLERFKASACPEEEWSDMASDGTIISSRQIIGSCFVYVFIWEDEAWKLAGAFGYNLSYSASYRDWQYLPLWLGEIMGEFPDDALIPERR